jgi:hypothetical protein
VERGAGGEEDALETGEGAWEEATPEARVVGAANGKLAAAYPVHSASLLCHFHPLVLQFDDDVAALRLAIGGGLSPSSSIGSTSAPPQSVSAVSAPAVA